MDQDPALLLEEAIRRVLSSNSPKKLIVAGPGTGKTTLFRKVLNAAPAERTRLVLTFINNLKDELHAKLSDIAQVFTFHGYCHYLLRKNPRLRTGLTEKFLYFPGVASLIKSDWEVTHDGQVPQFVAAMRRLEVSDQTDFYMERSNYYDAVEFDDSVFRTYNRLVEEPAQLERYDQIVVDEFQDFNRLEAFFIDLLTTNSPILIVGDDDQALYSRLRGSSHEFIRGLYGRGDYACFDLPFCLRSPKVVVMAFDDIVRHARSLGLLAGRIDKPYLYFPPKKDADSRRYPKIAVVQTSTQSKRDNYIGRLIDYVTKRIPKAEIEESRREGFPAVLVIGPVHFLRQIAEHLQAQGHELDWKDDPTPSRLERLAGLEILKDRVRSNLGWRIVLEIDRPDFFPQIVRDSIASPRPLADLVPGDYQTRVIEEAAKCPPQEGEAAAEAPKTAEDNERPTIKLTSFEGSKGLSAQHVFIVGLQEGELPRDASKISDLEICRLLVALTRTRKQCHMVYTGMFSGKPMRPSVFLSWIDSDRKHRVRIDKVFWQRLKDK